MAIITASKNMVNARQRLIECYASLSKSLNNDLRKERGGGREGERNSVIISFNYSALQPKERKKELLAK